MLDLSLWCNSQSKLDPQGQNTYHYRVRVSAILVAYLGSIKQAYTTMAASFDMQILLIDQQFFHRLKDLFIHSTSRNH